MTNFPSITDIENMGGIFPEFEFIPCCKIVSMTKPLNGKITTAIVLLTGASWYTGVAISGTLDFEEKQGQTNNGNTFTPVLKGSIPKLTPEYLTLFEEMSVQKFVVKHTDNNGNIYIIGTKEEGLTFLFDRKTNALATGLNGHSFEFSVVRAETSPFYVI
jgi:hypothetical protein